jgi:hypothetical protein
LPGRRLRSESSSITYVRLNKKTQNVEGPPFTSSFDIRCSAFGMLRLLSKPRCACLGISSWIERRLLLIRPKKRQTGLDHNVRLEDQAVSP